MQEHIFYTFDPYDNRPWEKSLRESYEDGIRIFSFLYPMVLSWKEDGTYDFSAVEPVLDRIMALIPEGKIIPRIFMTTPDWWDERYPDELLKFDGPPPKDPVFPERSEPYWKYESKIYHSWHNASIASERWRHDAGNALFYNVQYLLERYGKDRIKAIHIAYGTCGEWGEFGTYKTGQFANGDFSAPMILAYRRFLREKYGDSPEFETVLPPSKIVRSQVEHGMLRSPKSIQKFRDYTEAYYLEKNRSLGYFCRKVKEVSPELLCGSFGAYFMQTGCSAYSRHTFKVYPEPMLNISELDFVTCPNSYFQNRENGVFSQAPIRSVIRKKRFIGECDINPECSFSQRKEKNADRFLKATAFNLLSSGNLWHYDFGLNWYHSDEIRMIRKKLMRLDNSLFCSPKQAEIAFVIDPESLCCTEGSTGYYRQINHFLSESLVRCGAAADHICISDIMEMPPYKLYIFRDAFLFRPEIVSYLKENNASALWFGPAGCITPEKIDFTKSQQQTSFCLKEIKNVILPNSVTLRSEEHFLNENIELPYSQSGVEDLNAVWIPMLYAEPDANTEIAGLIESVDLPGVISRKYEYRCDVWSASPFLPSEFLRNLAKSCDVKLRVISGSAELYGAGDTFLLNFLDNAPLCVAAEHPLRNLISDEMYYPENNQVILTGVAGKCLFLTEVKPD